MSLEDLMQRAGVWRAGEMPLEKGLATGFPMLDSLLPGGGWPKTALTEILTEHEGIGALRLVLPVIAGLSQSGRWAVWISPPHIPYAPALQAQGVDLRRMLVVEPDASSRDDEEHFLWAFEQALRFVDCGAALMWLGTVQHLRLRRLQLACEAGETLGILFRPWHLSVQASPAVLRLSLNPNADGSTCIRILKCRGGVRNKSCRIFL